MLKIKESTIQNTKEMFYAVLVKSNSKQQEIEEYLNVYDFVKVSPYLYVNYERNLVDIVLDMQTIFHEVGSLEDIEYDKLIKIDECCDLL